MLEKEQSEVMIDARKKTTNSFPVFFTKVRQFGT